MSESRDPFENRLAEQLLDLGDAVLPRRTTDEVVASSAVAAEKRIGWRSPIGAIAVVVAVVATAVLAQRPAEPGVPSATTTAVAGSRPSPSQHEVAYTCGGHSFSPALFNEQELDLRSIPAGVALAEFIESGQGGEPLLPSDGWRLAGLDDSSASFVAALPGDPPYAEAQAENSASGWRIVGWGQCRPSLEMTGVNPATWTIAAGQEIDASSSTFLADVTETACASGRSSEDRVRQPLISYEPDRIVVIFTVEPLPGDAQECPGNPATRVRVELSEQIGDRNLFDGGALPWRNAGMPG